MTKLRGGATAPQSPFPVLPLRTGVLFPGTMITLPVGRERSLALLGSVRVGDIIGVVAQKDPKEANPSFGGLHTTGTFARVANVARLASGEFRLALEGLARFRLDALVRTDPFWLGEGAFVAETEGDAVETKALVSSLRETLEELTIQNGAFSGRLAATDDEPGVFADQVAASIGLATEQEIEVISELNITNRLHAVARLLNEAKTVSEVKRKIESEVRSELGKGQRDAILREQMRAIRKELGDDEKGEGELAALKETPRQSRPQRRSARRGRPRTQTPRSHRPAAGRARRDSLVPRPARRPAVVGEVGSQSRYRRRFRPSSTPTIMASKT